MKKLVKYFKRWNKWRKMSLNSCFYKFLVLIGIIKSSTFLMAWTDEDEEEYLKMLQRIFDQ